MIPEWTRENVCHMYARARLGEPEKLPPPEPVAPAEAMAALSGFEALLAPGAGAREVADDAAEPERAADHVLIWFAVNDDLNILARASAPAKRALQQRLRFAVEAARARETQGARVMCRVPRGLGPVARARLLLLQLLLRSQAPDPRSRAS